MEHSFPVLRFNIISSDDNKHLRQVLAQKFADPSYQFPDNFYLSETCTSLTLHAQKLRIEFYHEASLMRKHGHIIPFLPSQCDAKVLEDQVDSITKQSKAPVFIVSLSTTMDKLKQSTPPKNSFLSRRRSSAGSARADQPIDSCVEPVISKISEMQKREGSLITFLEMNDSNIAVIRDHCINEVKKSNKTRSSSPPRGPSNKDSGRRGCHIL